MIKGGDIRVVVAVLALSACQLVSADGILEGRVSDRSEKVFFDGALVSIQELNRIEASVDGGRFRFNAVPAGRYTVRVSYLGAAPVEQRIQIQDGETTEVSGDAAMYVQTSSRN